MTSSADSLPTMRTNDGAPRHWNSPSSFGVLLSSSDEVTSRTFDARTETWTNLTTAADAGAHGLAVRSAQPGIELEVMRLEDGTWRDSWGRAPHEVIAARWPRT